MSEEERGNEVMSVKAAPKTMVKSGCRPLLNNSKLISIDLNQFG